MTDNPTTNTDRHGPRDTERRQDSAWPRGYVEFGATDNTVIELHGLCLARGTDVVVSSTRAPTRDIP